ncbi:MAG: GTP-binding protein [Candidatus Heimdallarchaeota archaeon]|nr:MAG: GTP-binding protein [Candidatus Heimdallarchaeota archaeon]
MSDEWILKICSTGSYQVGKTSLIRRYAENKFSHDYIPTIGVDITTKRLIVQDHQIKLLLIDTAGQEFFGKIRPAYYQGAFGCIVVYDITRKETFEELDRWIADFKSIVGEETFITIIGNKSDLDESRSVSKEEASTFAEKLGVPFYECSAKLGGDIIPQIYKELIERYLLFLEENPY